VRRLPKYRFPSDPESAQRLCEVDALILKTMKLLKEIANVGERLYWSQNCSLEDMLRIDDLKRETKEFCNICYQYHFSLLQGKSVSDTDIADLQKGYERLKEAWLEFLAKNGLGIIYL
jgi:ABC-type uncharacterized transport system ATPase subunit